jgi:topoisomerase IV subunit B
VRIQEPVFESQTKTKLGSTNISLEDNAPTVRTFINDFIKEHLDNYLHMHADVKDALKKRIEQSERERKELAGVKKIANERAKKANLHNKKLRDCRFHYTDEKYEDRLETMLFITEGDSASGSITKARSPETQAVFSLRGKPLNCFGLSKKVVYENEEFNLLQHALDIENGIEGLRFNHIIIATDADVDGSHIRLLLLTFFLQFFPDVVREGHLFILQTPLFRVRNKKETFYCYSDEEKQNAIRKLGGKPEITRFKGLGEISPHEFEGFIGKEIKLDPVILEKESSIPKILGYYMGKNTPDRQNFIIENLVIEKDIIEEKEIILED